MPRFKPSMSPLLFSQNMFVIVTTQKSLFSATGGTLSETGSQPEQDRHGTPLSARGLPITPLQKGGDKLDAEDHDNDEDPPGDDDGNDPYGDTGGDYDDPDDFGFGHRVRRHPTVRHQPDPRNAMGEQIRENTIRKRISSTSLYYPTDPLNIRMQIK
jgi:hypothetical protein